MPEYLYSSYDDESIEKGTFGEEYIPRYYDNSHPQEEINDFILYYNPTGDHNVYLRMIMEGELKETVQLKFDNCSDVPIFTYRMSYYYYLNDDEHLYVYGTSYKLSEAKFITCIGKVNLKDIEDLIKARQQQQNQSEEESDEPLTYTMSTVRLENTITGNFGACYPGHHRVLMDNSTMEYDLPEDFPFPSHVIKYKSKLIIPTPRYISSPFGDTYYEADYFATGILAFSYLLTALRYKELCSLQAYQMGCEVYNPVTVDALFIYSPNDEELIRPILRIPTSTAVYFKRLLVVAEIPFGAIFGFGFTSPRLIPIYTMNPLFAAPQLYVTAASNYNDIFTGTPMRRKDMSCTTAPFFLLYNSGKSTFIFTFMDPNDFPSIFDPWYLHEFTPDDTHILYKFNSAFWEEGIMTDGLVIAKTYFYNIHEPLLDITLGGYKYYIDGEYISDTIPPNETAGILHADNYHVIATTFDVTIHIPGEYESNTLSGTDLIDFENTPANSFYWNYRDQGIAGLESENWQQAGFVLRDLWEQGTQSGQAGMLATATTTTQNMLFGSANIWVNHTIPRRVMAESENSFLIGVSSTGIFDKTESKIEEYIGNLRKDEPGFSLSDINELEIDINIEAYVAILTIDRCPIYANRSAFQFRYSDIGILNHFLVPSILGGAPHLPQVDIPLGYYCPSRAVYVPGGMVVPDNIYVSIYKYDVNYSIVLSIQQINRNDFEGYECIFTRGMMLSEGSKDFLLKPIPHQDIHVSSTDLELVAFYTRPTTVIGYPKIEEVTTDEGTTDIVVSIKDRLIVLSKTPEEQQIEEQIQQEWEQPPDIEDTLTLYSSDYVGKVYDISSLLEAEPFIFTKIGVLPTLLEDNLKIIDVTYDGAVPSF